MAENNPEETQSKRAPIAKFANVARCSFNIIVVQGASIIRGVWRCVRRNAQALTAIGTLTLAGATFYQLIFRLERIETRLQDVAAAMETLVVAQQITKLEDGNTIVLNYEPVPLSVRIIVGPLVNFPRAEYGYRLEGRRIVIENQGTLEQVTNRLPSGGVTVEYLRRVTTKDLQ